MKHIPSSHGKAVRQNVVPTPAAQSASSRGNQQAEELTSRINNEAAPEASRAPKPRAYASSIERGITKYVHPQELKAWIQNEALSCINRFRYVRAIDIAAACFASRPFPAAREAARRALAGLLAENLVLRYKTKIPKTFYALTAAGARQLQTIGASAAASTRSAANLSNAEHLLWANFLVIACEARGLKAMTESETLAALNENLSTKKAVQGLLEVVEVRGSKKRVSLRPDAIAFERDGITWFEVDASRRSPVRLERLSLLAKAVGKKLPKIKSVAETFSSSPVLRRVVVKTTEQSLFNRVVGRLREIVARTNAPEFVMTVDNNLCSVREVGGGTFSIWRADYDAAGQVQIDVCVGHVIVQMLPTGLPNFKGDGSWKSKPVDWFDAGGLPYQRPIDCGQWLSTRTPFEI